MSLRRISVSMRAMRTACSDVLAVSLLHAGMRSEPTFRYYFANRRVTGTAALWLFMWDEVAWRRRTGGLVVKLPLVALVGRDENAQLPVEALNRLTRWLCKHQGRPFTDRWARVEEDWRSEIPSCCIYISAVTVARPWRARGVASRWLDGLDRRTPIYLETGSGANRRWYLRRGFEECQQFTLPQGPVVSVLARQRDGGRTKEI